MFTFDLKIAQNILKGAACVDLEQYENKDILPDVLNVPAAPFEKTLVQLWGIIIATPMVHYQPFTANLSD